MSKRGKARKETLADADAVGKVNSIEAFIGYIHKAHADGALTDRQLDQWMNGLSQYFSMEHFCFLCDKNKAKFTAIFIPTDSFSLEIGAPRNKTRAVIYGMCRVCAEIPDAHILAENKILKLANDDRLLNTP